MIWWWLFYFVSLPLAACLGYWIRYHRKLPKVRWECLIEGCGATYETTNMVALKAIHDFHKRHAHSD